MFCLIHFVEQVLLSMEVSSRPVNLPLCVYVCVCVCVCVFGGGMGVTLIFQSLKLSKLYLSLGGQSFFSSVEMSVFEIFYSFAARTFKSVEYF